MPATVLDGVRASAALLSPLRQKVSDLDPRLVVVQVGGDAASDAYVRQKFKSCRQIGMRSSHRHLAADVSLEEILDVIGELNRDADVSGFIVQMPLPDGLQKHYPQIIRAIDPKKDVDGFGAYNLGKMFLSAEFEHLPPATPSGIISLLEYYDIGIAGKHAVVLGRSNIVGKPLAVMLLNRDATVTVCHSGTTGTKDIAVRADILISAVGKPKFVSADMVKDGAVVIDVGITRTDGGLAGDVDFNPVKNKASAITPVPGGVGPMTVASLIRNCVRAKERSVSAASKSCISRDNP